MENKPTLKLAAAYTAWGIIHCAAKSFTVTRHLKIPVSANYDDGRVCEFVDFAEKSGLLDEYYEDLLAEEARRLR